jgi:hypothetical protein
MYAVTPSGDSSSNSTLVVTEKLCTRGSAGVMGAKQAM